MSWICSKSDFSAVASEVEPQPAVRRSRVGLCVVAEGLRRKSLYLQGSQRVGDGRAVQQIPWQQLSPCFVPLESGLGTWANGSFSYLFINGCRIVHLKAITGACLCCPSGLGWDVTS